MSDVAEESKRPKDHSGTGNVEEWSRRASGSYCNRQNRIGIFVTLSIIKSILTANLKRMHSPRFIVGWKRAKAKNYRPNEFARILEATEKTKCFDCFVTRCPFAVAGIKGHVDGGKDVEISGFFQKI